MLQGTWDQRDQSEKSMLGPSDGILGGDYMTKTDQ